MHQNHLHTGIDFACAVAKHFKLPDTTDASMEMVTGANEVFGVKVKLILTADDLAAIADRMPGRSLPEVAAHAVEKLSINAWANERDTLLQGMSFDAWICHRAGVAHAAEAIGFDAWMRQRTEAAHQAMMRHGRLRALQYGRPA